MTSEIVNSILARIKLPDLVKVLANDLTGSEFNSILLETFNERIKSIAAPELLQLYQKNRFTEPADLPVLEMKRIELDILQLFEDHSFNAIELSPVTVLGSCSVVGPADQKKILSALRGTEVLADSTNAIALYVSDVRKKKKSPQEIIRLCNIQRMVRTQAIAFKGFKPHFRVGCLVSCGRDTGNFDFEKSALNEHVLVMKALFLEFYKIDKISFRLIRRAGYPEWFFQRLHDHVRLSNPETVITSIEKPEKDNNYYKGIQFKVDILHNGKTYEIADGGFVDWTQHLLQDKKERMFTTGFGFDLMYRILHGLM